LSKNIFKKVIDKKITRRSFLKWSSAIGATLSLSGLVVSESAATAVAGTEAGVTAGAVTDYIPSVCLVCHSWCRIAVGIDANKVVRKIEGLGGQPKSASGHTGVAADGSKVSNTNDDTYVRYCTAQAGQTPYSTHNRGRICAKGNDGMEHMYDPDRVKCPMIRVGKRGSGKWRKVSWGELYLGDQTCVGSPFYGAGPSRDILIDNGSGKMMHWQGIARVMRSLGGDPAAAIPTTGALGYGYTDNSGHYYSDVPAVVGTAPDHRHRLLFYIGRNEGGDIWGRFQAAFGTNHRIEHTNLCEESRHTANEWYCKDKFPVMNLNTHANGTLITDARIAVGTNEWTLSAKDNTDCLISWGGNHVESTIPHATLSQRVADVRRRGGLIVGIDVRQSNTLAYADDQFYVNPGTDGALAAGIIYEIMANYDDGIGTGSTGLKARIDSRPNTGAHYLGLFTAEEPGSVPTGKSIESYLFANGADAFLTAYGLGTYPDLGGPGRQFDATAASAICGVSATEIKYLAWLIAGGNMSAAFIAALNTALGITLPANGPRNPIVDGYRGPCKHSNGTYNYGLLRALQFIACGYNDGTGAGAGDALSEYQKRAGGFNRPGGLIQDSWNSGTGTTLAGFGGGPGGGANNKDGGWPAIQQDPYPAKGQAQLVDTWDYHGNGGSKWRTNKHHVFSNTLVGVRASLGLDPYKESVALTTINSNPFGTDYLGNANPAGNAYDDNFKMEVIFMHKVNAAYDLPNPALDREVFTSVGSNGYRLKHLWACDLCMGDGSMYADAILPDSSYLERYDFNDFENGGHIKMTGMRQPAIQDSAGKNGTLYGSKSIRNILYGLGRAIEADSVDINGDEVTPHAGGFSPWLGTCRSSFAWVTSGAVTESDWSDRDWTAIRCNGSNGMPNGYADGFEYYRTNGIYEGSSDNTPMFWKDSYSNVDSTGVASSIEFYHARLDAVADPTAGEVCKHPDGTFYGTPIFEPPRKQGAFTSPDPLTGKYNLTTYRLNVHTHARTASCPRLEEILGSNWAVMAPGAKDIHGTVIKNGDKVKVTSAHDDGITKDLAITRSIILEAKITKKTGSGTVCISHSQGHDLKSFGGDSMGGQGYDVSTDGMTFYKNRADASNYSTPEYGAMDQYRLYAAPTAPSTSYNPASKTVEPTVAGLNHGTHVNWATNRGGEDPVGTSVAYMDTMVTVEII